MDKTIDLVSLPKKSFWKLSLPLIAFCIFDAIYGIVDMLWISQINIEAFFALGVSIPFVSLIFEFGDSIGQGTNSIMSRFIGAGDYESSYNALLHGLILGNVIWIMIVLCLLFAHEILFFIDKANSYILVFDYMVPIVAFSYTFIFVNIFSETMQAEGNSRIPTVLIICSNILNIILDPIFIFNLNLGIKGAAYATVLSTFLTLIVMIYWYISGRTKVPLSIKYFKFRSYIFVEIFKVAIPNFLDDMLWCIGTAFANYILIMTMGPIGPIFNSASNKLHSLLIAPVKGFGRALMSVTGHLFGARKFNELEIMFKYVLKISILVTVVVIIVAFILRDYIFGLFSITGMETEVSMIASFGAIIMILLPLSIISRKMLDGFGKSMYSLLFSIVFIVMEVGLIYLLYIMSASHCVLIGMTVIEIIAAITYYVFLRYLFKNFIKKYDRKSTVKNLNMPDESGRDIEDKIDEIVENEINKHPSKTSLLCALIAMAIILLKIISIPVGTHNYALFASGVIALILGAISIHLMKDLERPVFAVAGFIACSVIILIFMGHHGHLAALFFILAGSLFLYIDIIIRVLKKLKLIKDD